ncbi:MAG: sugar phosphate isomerase/epimerase [Armatimonadetes bacterium]|nr:sugar phosphate isomerase/epimerase [Armatimonadota bacterium]
MSRTGTLPLALTAYSLPHVMGYLPTKSGELTARPLNTLGFLDAAVELGLDGVELMLPSPHTQDALNRQWATIKSLAHVPKAATEILSTGALKEALEERSLRVVSDFRILMDDDAETFKAYLRLSAEVGAKVVRCLLSPILCGDRRILSEPWEERVRAVAERLRDVLPCAHDLGLVVAMENHQDATSDDLLRLYDMVGNHPAYGITLDTGNPLSMGEDPVEAARRMGPLIRQVHLKDYTIHFAPEGYRLVRCTAGTGVIDFPAIMEIVSSNGHEVLPGIESAAQPTRTIPLLDDGCWEQYPPVHARRLIPALRILWEQGRPMDEPYSSSWERGADSETVSAEEWEVVRRSVDYFRSIL